MCFFSFTFLYRLYAQDMFAQKTSVSGQRMGKTFRVKTSKSVGVYRSLCVLGGAVCDRKFSGQGVGEAALKSFLFMKVQNSFGILVLNWLSLELSLLVSMVIEQTVGHHKSRSEEIFKL